MKDDYRNRGYATPDFFGEGTHVIAIPTINSSVAFRYVEAEEAEELFQEMSGTAKMAAMNTMFFQLTDKFFRTYFDAIKELGSLAQAKFAHGLYWYYFNGKMYPSLEDVHSAEHIMQVIKPNYAPAGIKEIPHQLIPQAHKIAIDIEEFNRYKSRIKNHLKKVFSASRSMADVFSLFTLELRQGVSSEFDELCYFTETTLDQSSIEYFKERKCSDEAAYTELKLMHEIFNS